jgi:DUF177 domain-containing protein
MDDATTIWVDRLRSGATEAIDAQIEVDGSPVQVTGQAYLAGEMLVLQVNLQGRLQIPCKICGEAVKFPLEIRDFYHTEEVSDAVFDAAPIFLEAALLEVPSVAECAPQCPHRKEMMNNRGESPGFHPFEEL